MHKSAKCFPLLFVFLSCEFLNVRMSFSIIELTMSLIFRISIGVLKIPLCYESPTVLSTPHSTQAPSTVMNTYYTGGGGGAFMSILFRKSIRALKISFKVLMNPQSTENPSQCSGTLHGNEHVLYRVVIYEPALWNIHRSTQDIP